MDSEETTVLINRAFSGDITARDLVFERLHDELRRMAAGLMRGEQTGHSWRPSDLLNECVIKLLRTANKAHGDGRALSTEEVHADVGSDSQSAPDSARIAFESRAHFFGAAKHAMRQLLIDHARWKGRDKRTPPGRRSALEEAVAAIEEEVPVESLDESLNELRQLSQDQYDVATGLLYGRLSVSEVAASLQIPLSTAYRRRDLARTFLYGRLRPETQ